MGIPLHVSVPCSGISKWLYVIMTMNCIQIFPSYIDCYILCWQNCSTCIISSFSHRLQCLILFANIAGTADPHGNSEALFWTIRMTVISTAINPFLYGILGGRYRRVYVYCLRAVFSKCCRCVRAPSRVEDKPFRRAEKTGTTS